MKSFLTTLAMAAALATLWNAAPVAHAQQAVGGNAPAFQYHVIDIGRIAVAKNQTPTATLEAILDDHAADGWRVVTTTGTFIILAR